MSLQTDYPRFASGSNLMRGIELYDWDETIASGITRDNLLDAFRFIPENR